MAAKSSTTKKSSSSKTSSIRNAKPKAVTTRTAKPAKVTARKTAALIALPEEVEPGRDELREAARVLKTKGSKKREKRAAAAVMSNYGSKRGGQNRARNLTPEQRKEIARLGGLKRQEMARQQRELREAVVEAASKKKARRPA